MGIQNTTNLLISGLNRLAESWRQEYLASAKDQQEYFKSAKENGFDHLVEEAEESYYEYAESYISLINMSATEEKSVWINAMNMFSYCYTDFIMKAKKAYGT